ncbi:DinB family protein [Streptomyces sp. NPDC054855]
MTVTTTPTAPTTPTALTAPATPTSTLDAERTDLLAGLIKHVASIEDGWLPFVLDGPSAMRYHQNDFRMLPGETPAGIIARYEEVAARTEGIIASVPDLSLTHPLSEAPWHEPGAVRSVRGVLMHVIAETAQHAGHADILREALDGRKAS